MRRFDPWRLLLIVYALVAAWYIHEIVQTEHMLAEPEPPEVTLPAIIVQMDDPYPCSTNLRNRIAYQKLGATCANP